MPAWSDLGHTDTPPCIHFDFTVSHAFSWSEKHFRYMKNKKIFIIISLKTLVNKAQGEKQEKNRITLIIIKHTVIVFKGKETTADDLGLFLLVLGLGLNSCTYIVILLQHVAMRNPVMNQIAWLCDCLLYKPHP